MLPVNLKAVEGIPDCSTLNIIKGQLTAIGRLGLCLWSPSCQTPQNTLTVEREPHRATHTHSAGDLCQG